MNGHQINDRQFEPTVINKKSSDVTTKKSTGFIQSEKAKLQKSIDDDTYKPKKYDTEFIKKLVAFRTSKGWNQQMFAQQVQIQLSIIKGIESNNISYNSTYLSKINNYITNNK